MLFRRLRPQVAVPRVAVAGALAAVAPTACGAAVPMVPPQQQRRWCSTTTATSPPAAAAETPAADAAPSVDPVAALHEELGMFLDAPIAIGTLFKTLSPENRQWLNKQRLPLETFLLRHPAKYSVYRDRGAIMVSRFGMAPETAAHAVEKTREQLFDGSKRDGGRGGGAGGRGGGAQNTTTTRIYTVLRYIPNEWVPYSALVIPDDVRKNCIGKPPKKFFEKNPRYFEVRFDPHRAHTFEVRRSLALQQYTAAQEKLRGGG